MKHSILLLFGGILIISGCDFVTTPPEDAPDADLAGTWLYTDSWKDRTTGTFCGGTAKVIIVSNGDRLQGTLEGTEHCDNTRFPLGGIESLTRERLQDFEIRKSRFYFRSDRSCGRSGHVDGNDPDLAKGIYSAPCAEGIEGSFSMRRQ